MPADGSRGQGRIPWWAYTMDDEGLGYVWDFYGGPGYADYPEECDEGVKEDQVKQRQVRIAPGEAPTSSAPRSALSRLILGFVARFKGARPERAAPPARGQGLTLGTDRS